MWWKDNKLLELENEVPESECVRIQETKSLKQLYLFILIFVSFEFLKITSTENTGDASEWFTYNLIRMQSPANISDSVINPQLDQRKPLLFTSLCHWFLSKVRILKIRKDDNSLNTMIFFLNSKIQYLHALK